MENAATSPVVEVSVGAAKVDCGQFVAVELCQSSGSGLPVVFHSYVSTRPLGYHYASCQLSAAAPELHRDGTRYESAVLLAKPSRNMPEYAFTGVVAMKFSVFIWHYITDTPQSGV